MLLPRKARWRLVAVLSVEALHAGYSIPVSDVVWIRRVQRDIFEWTCECLEATLADTLDQ